MNSYTFAFLALVFASAFALAPNAQICGDGVFYPATEQCDDGKPPKLHNFDFEANLEGWNWSDEGNARIGTGDETEFTWPIPDGDFALKVLWEWETAANISLSQDILLPANLTSGTMIFQYRLDWNTSGTGCTIEKKFFVQFSDTSSKRIIRSYNIFNVPCNNFNESGLKEVQLSLVGLPSAVTVTFIWNEPEGDKGTAWFMLDDIILAGLPEDGCDSFCRVEPTWQCTGFPSICTPICGDGIFRGDRGEICDDGNNISDDGCDFPICAFSRGWACNVSVVPSVCHQVCGDGVVTSEEICDDGNLLNGDGCANNCTVEDLYVCDGSPSICRPLTCGDGDINNLEVCDDGNLINHDGCSVQCKVEYGWECTTINNASSCVEICGNGLVSVHEQCDDANTISTDGCRNCTISVGYSCNTSRVPSTCGTICGDGIKVLGELCDDGNNQDGDGCSALCIPEKKDAQSQDSSSGLSQRVVTLIVALGVGWGLLLVAIVAAILIFAIVRRKKTQNKDPESIIEQAPRPSLSDSSHENIFNEERRISSASENPKMQNSQIMTKKSSISSEASSSSQSSESESESDSKSHASDSSKNPTELRRVITKAKEEDSSESEDSSEESKEEVKKDPIAVVVKQPSESEKDRSESESESKSSGSSQRKSSKTQSSSSGEESSYTSASGSESNSDSDKK